MQKKPPKNHRIMIQYPTKDTVYIITILGNDHSKYFLFELQGKEWKKIAQNVNPLKLEEKIIK